MWCGPTSPMGCYGIGYFFCTCKSKEIGLHPKKRLALAQHAGNMAPCSVGLCLVLRVFQSIASKGRAKIRPPEIGPHPRKRSALARHAGNMASCSVGLCLVLRVFQSIAPKGHAKIRPPAGVWGGLLNHARAGLSTAPSPPPPPPRFGKSFPELALTHFPWIEAQAKLVSPVAFLQATCILFHLVPIFGLGVLTLVLVLPTRGGILEGDGINGCYLVDPASSHMLVSKIKPCMLQSKSLNEDPLEGKSGASSRGDSSSNSLGARRRSDTVLVSTINDADQGSADVTFRTPLAPYEKSKSLGSEGSMVARLKLKGIDGRAPPGVEPAA
ncbi:hypothetical protein RJT34_16787 [Clitoria ternatea]|uniref:Uncharacterized protein n=1 Tax=Clitoria ternatea TaxID=43366 RepID=A0AAN9J9V6_CLITE